MGAIGPQTVNGYTYTAAYARMPSVPQAQKKAGMVRVYLDLHCSVAAYTIIKGTTDRGLKPHWLTVDILAAERPGRPTGVQVQPDGNRHISVVMPDVVRMWGGTPVDPIIASNLWPNNIYAQGWAMLMKLDALAGMDSDA